MLTLLRCQGPAAYAEGAAAEPMLDSHAHELAEGRLPGGDRVALPARRRRLAGPGGALARAQSLLRARLRAAGPPPSRIEARCTAGAEGARILAGLPAGADARQAPAQLARLLEAPLLLPRNAARGSGQRRGICPGAGRARGRIGPGLDAGPARRRRRPPDVIAADRGSRVRASHGLQPGLRARNARVAGPLYSLRSWHWKNPWTRS